MSIIGKFKSILFASLFALAGTVHAQIPVTDGAHIAATVSGNTEQIAKWVVQLEDMKTQIDKMQGVWSTLKDGRGMGNILNADLANQFLPKDYQAVAKAIREGKGDWKGISGQVADIVKANQFKACAELNKTDANRQRCEAQWRNLAMSKQLGDIGYKKATENIENLQQYIKSINSSTDQKVISEIQARIQVETVRMANEKMKLDTIARMEEADRKMNQQRVQDEFDASMHNMTRPSF